MAEVLRSESAARYAIDMTPTLTIAVKPEDVTRVLAALTERIDIAENALTVARARRLNYREHGGSHPAVILKHQADRAAALARLDEARFALRAVMDALGLES